MHTARIILAGGLALALSAISILCCFVFGSHLAPGNEGLIYGILGGVADALKAVLPIGIAAAWVARERARAITGAALFVVFASYSFASELGLYALSRDAQAGSGLASKESYDQIKADRKGIQDRLAALGQTRPSGTIRGDMAAARQNKAWAQSSECKDATGAAARTFCTGYEKLGSELASAEEVEKLRSDDAGLAQKLSGIDLAAVLRSNDPQSEALARFTGLAPATVRDALAILVAVLIELGSGLGLWVATAGMGRTDSKAGSRSADTAQAQTPPVGLPVASGKRSIACADGRLTTKRDTRDPIRAFLKQCAVKGRENEASASELHRAYLAWAESEKADAISAKALGTRLAAIGFERVKRGGVVRYRGVGLTRLN